MPVLVDTSIWVEHLRHGHPQLAALLLDGEVVTHPFVIGELACGNIKNRSEILTLLKTLPTTILAEDDEVFRFIEAYRLMGLGLGYIDIHLLTSSKLSAILVWTTDKILHDVANKLKLLFKAL